MKYYFYEYYLQIFSAENKDEKKNENEDLDQLKNVNEMEKNINKVDDVISINMS